MELQNRADISGALKDDYARFPKDQTYSLYDPNVFFKDPLVSFRGVQLYRWMIGFMERAFLDVRMDLHNIRRDGNRIYTDWTLSWVAPMPWKPSMQISGRSELALNADGLIQSHIDDWNCSRLDVLKQFFSR
jgi:hypothetical protein